MTNSATKTNDARLTSHPMYSPSDLRHLRGKGYTDEQILAFWDRDHVQGNLPVHHKVRVAIAFEGMEFPDADEALHSIIAAGRGHVIVFAGRHYAIDDATARRLEAEGVAFAYVFEHQMPSGEFRICTVPVNDD